MFKRNYISHKSSFFVHVKIIEHFPKIASVEQALMKFKELRIDMIYKGFLSLLLAQINFSKLHTKNKNVYRILQVEP